MKKLIRVFAVETFALYLASRIAEGIVFSSGIKAVLYAGGALMIAAFFVRPIVNLLLLPLNVLTFGLFKWVSHAIMLYLVDLVIDDFSISGFRFLGFVSDYINLPTITFPQGLFAYAAFAFLISLITTIIYWFVD